MSIFATVFTCIFIFYLPVTVAGQTHKKKQNVTHICALTTTGDAKLPKFSQLKFLARNKNDEKSYAAIDD